MPQRGRARSNDENPSDDKTSAHTKIIIIVWIQRWLYVFTIPFNFTVRKRGFFNIVRVVLLFDVKTTPRKGFHAFQVQVPWELSEPEMNWNPHGRCFVFVMKKKLHGNIQAFCHGHVETQTNKNVVLFSRGSETPIIKSAPVAKRCITTTKLHYPLVSHAT